MINKKTLKFPITILTLLCSMVLGVSINNSSLVRASEDPTAFCQGIANDENNNIYETVEQLNPVPRYRTLLKYDCTLGDAANEKSALSTTGQGILLNGVRLCDIPNTLCDYANGSKYIRIKIPVSYQDSLTGDVVLTIVSGTPFENKVLDEASFALRGGKWNKVSKTTFDKIEWNDIGYNNYASMKGVLLKYTSNLSKKQSEIDGGIQSTNFASTTGEHIYLDGVKISTLPGAFISYHSQGFLFIYATNMVSYRKLTIDEGTVFLDSLLPELKLYYNLSTQWTLSEKSYSPVTFSLIRWNNTGYNFYKDMKGVLLEYSANFSNIQSEKDGGLQSTNFAASLGRNIYLGETQVSTIEGAYVSYHSTSLLFVYAPNMTTLGNLKIEVSNFMDITLPELELKFNGTKWEVYTEIEKAHCQGIANDVNNNIYEDAAGGQPARYRTIIKYDCTLGDASNDKNVVSTTGRGITLNGVKLSEITHSRVDYAHGKGYLEIKIPADYQDALSGDIFLEIIDGTPFENKILDGYKFILRSNQWATYQEPSKVNFSSILWNNYGSDAYTGKNGILLSYSNNLSNVSKEIKGSMKLENQIGGTIGSKVKLNGVSINTIPDSEIMYFGGSYLWIYTPHMTTYKELVVESVSFLTAILPETHFALFGNVWAESFKITHIINGVEKVEYCKKSNSVTLGQEHYESLLSEENLSAKLASFKIGDVTFGPTETFIVKSDITVNATIVGFETTQGAAIRMTDPSQMRFESKIDKEDYDYLVNLYGADKVETGTYIIPNTVLGLTSFIDYVNDPSYVEGVDYIKCVNHSFANASTASSDGYYKYYGVLGSIIPEEYSTSYMGVGYIKYTDNEGTNTIYGNNEFDNWSRSVYEVIKSAYKNYKEGSKEKNILNSYLNGIVSIINKDNNIELDNSISGYNSPYSINFNSETGEYIISGNSDIKTVLINGVKKSDKTNVMKINDQTYKLIDFSLTKDEGVSTMKFKKSQIKEASELVDFTLKMPTNREMKILQITDTQIIDSSQMRTEDRLGPSAVKAYSRANIDKRGFNHIASLIESENPDLILFTGDIVYGEFDDNGEILTRIVDFMDSFDIPWAPIFGNHDNETKMGVDWQCQQFENAKNCLFKQNTLTGNGNYSIGLVDNTNKIRRVIYMMDSNGCLKGPGIANDQIAWMENTSNAIDTAYDEKVKSFACYHIPSLDFKTALESKYGTGSDINLDLIGQDGDFGQKKEKVSLFNTSLETNLKNANVDAVFAGHDHVNNFSVSYNGIRYTYGTKTGTYDYYNGNILGGTLIRVTENGEFDVSHRFLDEKEMENKTSASFTVTIFSDLHYDTSDYGGFYCTKSLEKLTKIINETKGSRFYISLGDVVNSCYESLNNYYAVMSKMIELGLNVFNPADLGYIDGNRMIYNLIGNHETAYDYKESFKDYVPYVEGVGSTAVFKQGDIMFIAVDGLFTRTGSDNPEDIITCTEFMITDAEINWLKNEISNNMDDSIKGIVWISHVALKDIDSVSQSKLFSELRKYDLPLTVFEGHTHVEAYRELKDEVTGKVYCKVYTLPAVTLYNNYPYYNVTFVNGQVWYIDKQNGEL